ncbi:MAG TPA: tRNA pseudouridine(38-40) synthase TruA [Bacteroidales bacterium]|jgi:tRNA pseudouridine38-40 synthase|nr:tRNA pseudouridine(38-40) synthase TruA [Bacteroidales bacterium]HBZ20141.1 tRNA pseudouridine(38-40) synthase TruA [Bacteroidales bacterium]
MPIFAEIYPVLTRYFINISFKGTIYHGWQVQPKSVTVQKILDEAITVILGEKTSTTGAGRTDAGVHARIFCAHFDSQIPDLAKRNNFIFRLNRFLPDDISVTGIRKVLPDANARFSALSRTYKYFISRVKDPFNVETSWFVHGDLDVEAMNTASKILLNHSDFTSFSRLHSDNKTNLCKIYSADWIQDGNMLVFTIRADRFLRNMVRAIVGTMIETGRGKLSPDDFEKILESRNRSSAGMSAPAKGLFLTSIVYPEEIFV